MNTAKSRKLISILSAGFILFGIGSGFNFQPPGLLTQADVSEADSLNAPVGKLLTILTPTPTLEAGSVSRFFENFNDISFYYSSALASKVTGRNVEASVEVNNPITPKMDQFEFQNYPVISQLKPRISIFALQDVKELGGESAVKQLVKLNQLITGQPADPPGELPQLLGEPSTQLLHTGMKYVNFQNGKGIRYLTEYAEQPWPVDYNLLFYTFQGMTDDGAFYISAVLPVNHAEIAGDDGFLRMKEDAVKFQANYPAYVDYMEKQLNAELPDSFSPNLALMDAMIKSMIIEKKVATPGKPTSQPTATVTNSPSGCTNQASFVADVTIPDETVLQPGASFTKTWRFKNSGTCTWTPGYKLVFLSGDAMGATATIKLTNANVPPNANLNVSVPLKAPDTPGRYKGYFKMRAQDGTVFGIEPNGINPFWVLINVPAPEPDTPTNTPIPPPLHIVPPIKPKLTAILPPKLVTVQP